MIDLIVELSRYGFVILIRFTPFCAFPCCGKKDQNEVNHGWKVQNLLTFLIHLLAFVVIFIQTWQVDILIFYLLQFFLLQAVLVFTRLIYPADQQAGAEQYVLPVDDRLVILTRLSYDRAGPGSFR